ncbi:RNA polymerase-associated factor, variant 2 [Batrachochytrium dendrobatidis]|uniref:RNA polymerase II-associated factor 1 homolog n=1 Tax=Batrachochytrium dendrobatidis (strain JEL423) TaxID=403673 RepID=A0A177WHT1_BATDL|nr:RNA polymerase-associated factor, variant 2 [Batrachochytrium dendrobatidis]KAK5672796.1 RNA polymerase-associated factor, variant 2 [Batrachochytrium dendrobatidis]OAJ39060.1 hypothetical protein, variant [Batrachochytrium dendrobatidis JEL423]
MRYVMDLYLAALLQPNPDALDPEDLELLVPPVDAKLASDNAEATRVRPVVPWLRRTEYVAVEGKTYGRRADTGVETKMGISIKKDKHLSSLMDRSEEAQMLAIENTFETAAAATLSNLKHPTNPDLKLVEIFPIYPDFEFWPNLYQLVTFDDDPISRAPGGGATDADGTEYEHDLKLDRAIIKPIANPEDDTDFTMAFYTPTDASASAVREHRERQKHLMAQGHDIEDEDEDQSHEYKFRRDFDESVSKSNYPFCIELRKEEGGAFYSMLPKRMTLRKKRALNKRERDYDVEYEKPTKILVSHRELTAEEISERNTKMKDLLQRDDIDDE